MDTMLIGTLARQWQIACGTDQTNTSFSGPIPQIATPSGDSGTATGGAVFDLAYGDGTNVGNFAQNFIRILPYGVGSDDTTFSMRVYGWTILKGGNQNQQLWIPLNFIEIQATLSTAVGVDGSPVDSTHKFADIITVTTGSTLSGELAAENIVSTTNNTIASLFVDLRGSQKFSLHFNTGSSATSCNALWTLI